MNVLRFFNALSAAFFQPKGWGKLSLRGPMSTDLHETLDAVKLQLQNSHDAITQLSRQHLEWQQSIASMLRNIEKVTQVPEITIVAEMPQEMFEPKEPVEAPHGSLQCLQKSVCYLVTYVTSLMSSCSFQLTSVNMCELHPFDFFW